MNTASHGAPHGSAHHPGAGPDPTRPAPPQPAADGARLAYGAGVGRAAGGKGAGGAPAVHVTEQGLPDWLRPVAEAARTIEPHQLSRFLPPKNGSGRQSAVLVLFGEGAAAQTGEPARAGARAADAVRPGRSVRTGDAPPTAGHAPTDADAPPYEPRPGHAGPTAHAGSAGAAPGPGPTTAGHAPAGGPASAPNGPGGLNSPGSPGGFGGPGGPELLLMERAGTLRSHAGQPSFPGGALDPEDGDPAGDGPLRAALREAEEETGLDPSGVQLFGVLPRLYIPVSEFVVTPVLGWWRSPSPVAPVDPAETARVFTVPVAELTDPANRALALHPSGHRGPAFLVGGALVWGFTAGVIDRILHFAGWERPWDRDRHVPLDWRA